MYRSVAVTMRERRARSQREEDVGFKGHSARETAGRRLPAAGLMLPMGA